MSSCGAVHASILLILQFFLEGGSILTFKMVEIDIIALTVAPSPSPPMRVGGWMGRMDGMGGVWWGGG